MKDNERLHRTCLPFTYQGDPVGYLGVYSITHPNGTMDRYQFAERCVLALVSALMLAAVSAAMIGFLLLATVVSSNAQTAEDLFQKALRMERTNGNYAEAVDAYRAVYQHPDADRELEARALLQMGLAYENLGRTEAKNAYETLVRDYSDIAEVLPLARDGLSRTNPRQEVATTTPAPGSITALPPDVRIDTWGASMSPDGKYIAAVSEGTYPGLLAISTGEFKSLRGADAPDGYAEYVRMSPDQKTVAYGFWAENSNVSDLRLVDVATKTHRVHFDPNTYLLEEHGIQVNASEIQPLDWFEDGSTILAFLWAEGTRVDDGSMYNNQLLMTVPLHGGSPRIILEGASMDYFSWMSGCLVEKDTTALLDFTDGPGRDFIAKVDLESGSVENWRKDPVRNYTLFSCPDEGGVIYSSSYLTGTGLFQGSTTESGSGISDTRLINIPEKAWSVTGSNTGDVVYFDNNFQRSLTLLEIDPETGNVVSSRGLAGSPDNVWYSGGYFLSDSRTLVTLENSSGLKLLIRDVESQASREFSVRHNRFARNGATTGFTSDEKYAVLMRNDRSEPSAVQYGWLDLETGELVDSLTTKAEYRIREIDPGNVTFEYGNLETGCLEERSPDHTVLREIVCVPDTDLIDLWTFGPQNRSRDMLGWVTADTTLIWALMHPDGSGYEKVLEAPKSDPESRRGWMRWLSEDVLYYALMNPWDGPMPTVIKDVYRLDLSTGISKQVLPGLSDHLNILNYRPSPDEKYMVVYTRGKGLDGDSRGMVIHSLLDLE